ncbi:MAG: hypothetical protein AB2693_35255 [Candidatus Thiodiazotropha sp.]
MPYDLNLPSNWSAAKLKTEIAALGVNLTSQSIPKSALLQIYEQLSVKSNNEQYSDNSNNVDTSTQDPPSLGTGVTTGQQVTLPVSVNLQNSGTESISESHPVLEPTCVPGSNLVSQNQLQAATPPQDSQSGLIGIVSAMQGTITSLQSTINNLLLQQNSSAGPGANYLEQYYNGTNQRSTNSVNQSQIQGIAADNLPHIDVVTDSVRKNIISGKYVNLASLLIPDYDTSKLPTDSMVAVELLKRQQRDHRLDRALTITQFFKAFGVYKRIMCEAFPQRRDELDLYEADIGNIYEHYGDIFYQYHVQFSRQAAAYMMKGIKVDWSKRHKDLFQLLIGGTKTKLCEYCFQADHQSPFCPTQINVSRPLKQRPNLGLDSTKEGNRDSYGRSRVTFKGKEICNNFNGEKGCTRSACAFEHICKKCKGPGHGQYTCHPQTVTGSGQSKSGGDKNKHKSSE